jgi:hypothetical protein
MASPAGAVRSRIEMAKMWILGIAAQTPRPPGVKEPVNLFSHEARTENFDPIAESMMSRFWAFPTALHGERLIPAIDEEGDAHLLLGSP